MPAYNVLMEKYVLTLPLLVHCNQWILLPGVQPASSAFLSRAALAFIVRRLASAISRFALARACCSGVSCSALISGLAWREQAGRAAKKEREEEEGQFIELQAERQHKAIEPCVQLLGWCWRPRSRSWCPLPSRHQPDPRSRR